MSTSQVAPVGYELDLDEDWIAVPPSFPFGEWASAESWARDLAQQAFGVGSDAGAQFEATALSLTVELPPFVDHTLWFSPIDGRSGGVAFLTVASPEIDVEGGIAWAMLGIESLTPPQVHRHSSSRFGEIIQSVTTFRHVTESLICGSEEFDLAGRVRTVAMGRGAVFILEALSTDLVTLAVMQPSMIELVDSIREVGPS